MAINGAHVLLYTSEPEAVRAVLRDVLAWPNVDAGGGWLIFGLPPAELGVHPAETPRTCHVEDRLGPREGPVVAATDYVRAFAEQIRPWVARRYKVLGTDGYGRSDYRRVLRRFFEVDRNHIAVAALKALADEGELEPARVQEAIERYEIDAERPIATSL